ncbi:substrate-binding domain-containing protein [Pokkaliibacter sp. MBI-7]|uniref:LacI family DNA-binding transcriptional regulator n=1 Tax=Pokkaliibacter sp. MBI-7 TaxID=3040600 RepID=UPI002448C30D|nr:substrate-binding domain-containing protein [Pokkaliibacter sp. MBI-7]MDH2436184.1 substrate-binding domain-containing protein [Pokkaliibacter sp. MBI-7]
MSTDEDTSHKITAMDVARHAGVSKWIVSRAMTPGASISASAKEKVLRAAAELGYKPNLLARSLSTRSSTIVGLVVDEMASLHILPVIDEITRQLQREGYIAMMLNISSHKSYERTLSLAEQFQVSALIFIGTLLTDELIELARDIKHIPLIVMYRHSNDPNIQVVSTHGYQAGQEIAGLLLQQPLQRIGYMAGPKSESTMLRRFEGFRDRLKEGGLVVSGYLQAEHYQRKQALTLMTHYLQNTPAAQRIEAIFCENDILAMGALEALHCADMGGQMGVIGFDDIDLASSPLYNLTSYRQPMHALIAEVMKRLKAPRSSQPLNCLIAGELIVRGSHIRRVEPDNTPMT